MMRVLVCGGRNFEDSLFLSKVLNLLTSKYPIHLVITGDARGADSLARKWATERHILYVGYKARWDEFTEFNYVKPVKKQVGGRIINVTAGLDRNFLMLREAKPDLVVAFPGGTGTQHMINLATQAGVKVWKLNFTLDAYGRLV